MITVKDLIEVLQDFPKDMEVVREYDSTYYELEERELPKIQRLEADKIYPGTYYEASGYSKDIVKKVCI